METNEIDESSTTAQAGAEDGKNAETSTAAEEATATGEANAEETAAQEAASKPVPKYTDADMAEVRRKYQGETRKERDARIAAETEARLLREMHSGKTERKDTAPQELVRPSRENFDIGSDGEAAYEAAKEEYIIKKTRAELKAENERETQQKTVKQQREQEKKTRDEFLSKGVKDYGDDFSEALTSPNLDISTTMRDSLFDSEIGPKLAKHLIDNPDIAAKIAALPTVRQVKEMLSLENTLKTATKQTTKAPEPLTDVKGGGKPEYDARYFGENISTEERIAMSRARQKK